MIRAILSARREDVALFWRRLAPFVPLFVSSVAAIPSSPIRIYAALYTLLAAFIAASRVINDHVVSARQSRRQEDMWAALQGFMTVIALVAKDRNSGDRATLHKKLNQIALAAVQRAGVRRAIAPGEIDRNPPRVVLYLLLSAGGGGSDEPVQELRRYQWRGYRDGAEPRAVLVAEQSAYSKQLVNLALDLEPRPLLDGEQEDDSRRVACLTVPVRQDEITWGVLRVESSDLRAFTATDSAYLTLIATGLAQALTLLGDDAEGLLNYDRDPTAETDENDEGDSDHE